MRGNILYFVIPCYNEEKVIIDTAKVVYEKTQKLIDEKKISEKSRIVFVNDGSKDRTWEIIKKLHEGKEIFAGINLSRNRGHQNALLAGLMTVKDDADMVISMDADLQDDINAVDEMIEKYQEGCEIVYGVRSKRDKDTFFKRFTAESFYKIMNKLGANTVYNHADYRLTSRRALDELAGYKEVNLFLRGIIPMIGFKTDVVYYERGERMAGESKYPLKKMISFSIEGMTSLSVKPLSMITYMGIGVFFISFIMLIYSIIQYFSGTAVPGWSSLIFSIWAIGGLILFSIGITGAYIGKIYLETKGRPRFTIDEYLNNK